jgi:DNA polymerase-1
VLAFDTETLPFGPARMAPPLVCLQVGDATGAEIIPAREAAPYVRAMLEGDDLLVGAHPAYDMACFCAEWPDLTPAVFAKYERDQVADILIRQKLVDLAAGTRRMGRYSLAALAKRHLGVDLGKGEDTWRLHYGELRDIPVAQWPEDARAYAELDVIVPAQVYPLQGAPHPDEYRQARASFWLQLMSVWGLTTDPEAVARFEAEATADVERLTAQLVEAGLVRAPRVTRTGKVVKPSRNVKAARERMVAAGSKALTAKEQVSLSKHALRDVADPIMQAYGDLAGATTRIANAKLLRDGHIGGKKGHIGARPYLIHPRVESLLENGRTSTSPNVQNMRREGGARECFVPPPGHLFIAADYGMMELRTLAQACLKWLGKSKLAEALNAGIDPHLVMAATILGIPIDEAFDRRGHDDVKAARQLAKIPNFGFPGGLGANGMVRFAKGYGRDVTKAETARWKELWFRTWPEMRDYFAFINTKGTRTYAIEQLYSGRVRAGMLYCDACNTPFSGLAADAAKAAGWLVSRAMYTEPQSPLFDCRTVNFIHDELIGIAPEARAPEAADELARLMVAGAQPWLPDVKVEAAAVVMRRWYKGAEPLRVDGRLVPVRPVKDGKRTVWVHDT